MRKKWIYLAPVVVLLFIAFIAVGGQVVRELWNWLMPSLFGWREITFWQALGLLALCRILFGGFGMHGGQRSNMRQRMERMTPEEREKFQKRFWGPFASADSKPSE